MRYDATTKFGQTFRSLMKGVREALEDRHHGTRQLGDIRKFSVPVKGGGTFVVEVHPEEPPHYSVSQSGREVHTDMFDDILDPLLEALGNAKLSDSSLRHPASVLRQATDEEHRFSDMLNG